MRAELTETASLLERLVDAVGRVVLGQDRTVRLAVAAWASGRHLLVQDHPGSGKTTLARAVARALGADAGRIQGTPDLLPTDLTGVEVYRPTDGTWELRRGPLFHEVVLVDEIDRISPRTQSALLEAMAERQITVDGRTHVLPPTHWVIATRLPDLDAGGFSLLPAQLDRFGVSVEPEPLDRATRAALLAGTGGLAALAAVDPVAPPDALARVRHRIEGVTATDAAIDHALALCDAAGALGHLSVRPAQDLLALGRALAVLSGRDHVRPTDLAEAATPVLAHRVGGDRSDIGAHLSSITPPW